MTRKLTDEHKAAMREGHERWAAEERERRKSAWEEYRVWLREDARLWRAYISSPGRMTAEGEAAYNAWRANLRNMPKLP